jgi:hypothetical protein
VIRGSDKHSSRVDEQLEHEVEALVKGSDEGRTEYRSKEMPGDEEGGLGYPARLDEPGHGMTEGELAAREQLARHLIPSLFPATADELLEAARDSHAPPDVMTTLEGLPKDVTFSTTQQVWDAVRTV